MSRVSPRRDTKGEATRTRVLAAAAAVFRERGYAGVRFADIAERAGMQAGSLYYHFASREELVAEVLEIGHGAMVSAVRDRVQALPADSDDTDRLREAMTAHVVAVLGSGDHTLASLRIIGQVPDEIRTPVLGGQAAYGEFWRSLLSSAQASGAIRADADLPAVRMLLMGGLNTTTEWYQPRRSLTPERLAAGLAALCLDGVAARRGQRHRPVPLEPPQPPGPDHPRQQPRRNATRARILTAAAATFAEQGYAAARLVDIATAAGMQTGSLYYHFASREDLVAELLRIAAKRTHDAVAAQLDALPASATGIDRLTVAMGAHLGSIWAPGSYAPALVRIFAQVPQDVRQLVQPERHTYAELWNGLLSDAAGAGELRTDLPLRDLQRVLNGAMNWTVEWYRPDGRLGPGDVAHELARMAFDGLLTP